MRTSFGKPVYYLSSHILLKRDNSRPCSCQICSALVFHTIAWILCWGPLRISNSIRSRAKLPDTQTLPQASCPTPFSVDRTRRLFYWMNSPARGLISRGLTSPHPHRPHLTSTTAASTSTALHRTPLQPWLSEMTWDPTSASSKLSIWGSDAFWQKCTS